MSSTSCCGLRSLEHQQARLADGLKDNCTALEDTDIKVGHVQCNLTDIGKSVVHCLRLLQ